VLNIQIFNDIAKQIGVKTVIKLSRINLLITAAKWKGKEGF
jgi:hypothetical protein